MSASRASMFDNTDWFFGESQTIFVAHRVLLKKCGQSIVCTRNFASV